MDVINIESLLNHIRKYNECEIDYIKKAYDFANKAHAGAIRQSGEPYITHPLSVAYILSEKYADKDTICAALLHDVIEDSEYTKEDIEREFNSEIAKLVYGVTKLSKLNFTANEKVNLNTRKILESLTEDIRIIIIKLADRLHNMRTLQYKSINKQIENANETMELYVPLANYIGDYRTKSELEDLSLRYLKPEEYQKLELIQYKIVQENQQYLSNISSNLKEILESKNIHCEIKERIKNIYGIYNRLEHGYEINNIHDLFSLKIMIEDIDNCYIALRHIHDAYKPINNKFKDYICNPKTNLYQSLHTTVFGPFDKLVQIQVRTFEMDKIASFGLTAYWEENKGLARKLMQQDLKDKFQFYKTLSDISSMFTDNQQFIEQIKQELLSEKIFVYTPKGEPIELPVGSTLIDAAYKINPFLGNNMQYGIVNNERQNCNYVLNNKDRIYIETNPNCVPQMDWLNNVKTTCARKLIIESCDNQ